MVAPLLIANLNATDSDRIHQVYIMTGTDIEQLGDDIDEVATLVTIGGPRYTNSVISAWGSVYVGCGSAIFKLTNGSLGTWSNDSADGAYTFPTIGGNNPALQGPYFASIGGIPYLFGTHHTGNNNSRVHRLNLLTGTGERSSADQANAGYFSQTFYDNKVFATSDGLITVTDPANLSITTIATPGGTDDPSSVLTESACDFNVYNGKLYMVGCAHGTGAAASGLPTLYEWGAGQFTAIVNDFETVNRAYATTSGRWCLFDDGVRMYIIYFNNESGNEGWKMFQLDYTNGNFVKGAELTNTVLPAAVRPGNNSVNTSAWAVYKDQKNDGTADIYLMHAANSTGGFLTMYQFIDNTTEMQFVQSGADSRYAIPNHKTGGGDREVDLTAPSVCVYAKERNSGGEKITFRAFPPILPLDDYVGTDHVINFYFGIDQDVPLSQALLTGAVTGGSAVRVGNSVTGVTADGVTDYTAIIQPFGFEDLDIINLVAEIS